MPTEKKKSLRENVFKGNWDGAARVKKNKLSVRDEISRKVAAEKKQSNKFDHLLRSQVLYIREPDDKWMKDDSKDCFVLSSSNLLDPSIRQFEPTQKRIIVEKNEEKRREEKMQEEKRQEEKIQDEKRQEQIRALQRPKLVYLTDGILEHVPSLTYNQKMKNWFDMNKQTTQNDTKLQTSRPQGIYTNTMQSKGHDFVNKMKQERIAQERNARLGLMARFNVNPDESTRTSTPMTLPETKYKPKDKTNKETTVIKDHGEIYTRLTDGLGHVKGDFENAKRNLGLTKEAQTQQELKQERWDNVIRQHLQEKIEAGKKGYVPASVLEEERTKMRTKQELSKPPAQTLTQDEIIQGLKNKIKEISLKISNTPHSSKYPTKPNEFTVEELKRMLDTQCKASVPKYSIEEFRAVLRKLGFHKNVVNYKDLVDKLNNVAILTYGRPLHHKQTQQYLKHESRKFIAEQELENIRQTGSTISIHRKINAAKKNVGIYLQRMKSTDRRFQHTPVLHLFNKTYNNIRENKDKVVVQGPKSYKGKKRIKEADEFWNKYGRGKGKLPDMNRYKLELENKHQNKFVNDLTTGFTSKLKEEYPTIFQMDNSHVKLTQNFTTPDLISAMNRILHQPVPLHKMMDSYNKKIDSIRVKHPKLFHSNN